MLKNKIKNQWLGISDWVHSLLCDYLHGIKALTSIDVRLEGARWK